MRPRLLDLYSGAGGAAAGYAAAGFEVVGVDIRPQPRYPYEHHVADAMRVLDGRDGWDLHEFDAVHTSPPCRDHSTLAARAGKDGTGDLLPATRAALDRIGLPYVIENVPGAPMRPDIILCGEMFGLRTIRHRWFELGGWWELCPMHPPHTAKTSTRNRIADFLAGMHISVTGNVGVHCGPEAMDIDWMTGNELSQAIPPPYTRWLGERLLAHLATIPTTGGHHA